MILVGVGFVQLFMPFNHMFEIAYSVGGCAIFSGYIMYDTWMIERRCVRARGDTHHRLSPDDWVLANVSLYLDVINLFISILRRACARMRSY